MLSHARMRFEKYRQSKKDIISELIKDEFEIPDETEEDLAENLDESELRIMTA